MTKAEKLRELFKRKGIIVVMGAHNGLSAKLAESAGFDAIWASGFEISTAHCVPDANILTMTDFLNVASSMNEGVQIPVIADCDTGFGNSNNVIHMVKKYEAAGIAAVCIEDKLFPKVNSFIPGRQDLASIAEFVGKVLAAKNAQLDPNFMVIARVEALIAGWGMDEAIKRANAYADAGADAILIHSKLKTPDEIFKFAYRWQNRIPLVVVPTTYYGVTARELQEHGINMVIYANQGMRAAIKAMRETFFGIFNSGSSALVEDSIVSMKEVFDIQGIPKMKEDEKIYSRSDSEKVVAVIPAAGDHLEEYSMKDISSDIPISMLDINGKSLLQRQAEVLNRGKVYEIYVVAGYKKEKIDVEGVKIVSNERYHETGILHSIMKALMNLKEKVFILYGDILFDFSILEKISKSDKDITILISKTGKIKNSRIARKLNYVVVEDDREPLRKRLNPDCLARVEKIYSCIEPEEHMYEFPGILFLSKKGVDYLREFYNSKERKLQNADITELLQEIILSGIDIWGLEINSGWLEIHSMENYRAACALVK